MNHIISQFASQPPDNINDILPLEKMNESISADVWKAIKSINELVLFDSENDYFSFIEGGFTAQVLGYSLQSIQSLTASHPLYIVEVIDTFQLDQYLTIPEEVYTNAGLSVP
jgi:hypothetical protein